MKYVIPIVLVALLVAACAPTTDTGGTATGDGIVADENTVTVGSGSQASGSDAKTGLKSIFDKYGKLEYMVAYDVTASYDGTSETTQMTQYLKGKSMRMDVKGSQDGTSYEARTFILPNEFITCNKQDATWTCMKIDAPEDEQSSDLASKYAAEGDAFWEQYQVFNEPDRTIAGTKAKCFKMAFAIQGEGSFTEIGCYSAEGVPLYIEVSTPQGSNIMKATSYKTSVSASDLTPPATPTSLEDMMAQYGAGMPDGFDPSAYS